MNNISLEKCEKYENSKRYELVENGVYLDSKDDSLDKYRMTISYELESDETNNQYPLEDILDKYLLHVSDFYKTTPNESTKKFKIELAGDLKGISTAKREIIGKKIFNREYIGTDGKVYVDLIIE
ncbi:hypothetical protein [uncultured Winogradskyella sp.]|uniref:hypothetical protein n=1 Tax=uncultured Winogradskyella sp. TaxID=395353 RepID=UPI0026373E79|nr:hypothetical protein [uncultured Winogradskyella sp.]